MEPGELISSLSSSTEAFSFGAEGTASSGDSVENFVVSNGSSVDSTVLELLLSRRQKGSGLG